MIPGLLATGMSIALSAWQKIDAEVRDRNNFISHPYAFQLFAYLLGFLMVFRTNFAYNRYWEGIGMVQAMGAKWLDGAAMAITFDAGGSNATPLLDGKYDAASSQPHPKSHEKGGPTHATFVEDILHLCSLLHALALMHLRGDDDLGNLASETDNRGDPIKGGRESEDQAPQSGINAMLPIGLYDSQRLRKKYQQQHLRVLGGLSKAERAALEVDMRGKTRLTEARVAMVEGWYMRRLIARQKFEQGESAVTSPPILSRLYQVISDGCLWFGHASKIAITPFPFPYHNLIAIFLWAYTFMVPFLINGVIMNDVVRAVFTFAAVFSYHSLSAVGDNLEDPYIPYDPNELPLQDIQDSLNQRLLAFAIVPQH